MMEHQLVFLDCLMSVDLKFYKYNMKEEFIDQSKLTKFEIICLFLMATYKEKDLVQCQKEDNYINWGEIERYSRFGIDFTKMKWLQDVAVSWCPERLLELMDNFANAGFKLHQYLESQDWNNKLME